MTPVPKPKATLTLLDIGALVSLIIIVCDLVLCGVVGTMCVMGIGGTVAIRIMHRVLYEFNYN